VKKILSLLVLPVLLIVCVSCEKQTEIDMGALREELLAAGIFQDELVSISEQRIAVNAGIDTSLYVSGEFWMGSGITGEEIGLFTCDSTKNAKALAEQLTAHNADLYSQYEGYKQEALPRIKNYILRQSGNYVAYVTAENYAEAGTIVDKYFK